MLRSEVEVLSTFHNVFVFFSARGMGSLSVYWPHRAPQSRFPLVAPEREGGTVWESVPLGASLSWGCNALPPPTPITEWLSNGSPASVPSNPESSGQSLPADPNGLEPWNLPAFCKDLVPSIQHVNNMSSSLTTSTHLCFGSGYRNEFFFFCLWTIKGRSKVLRKLRDMCSLPLVPT